MNEFFCQSYRGKLNFSVFIKTRPNLNQVPAPASCIFYLFSGQIIFVRVLCISFCSLLQKYFKEAFQLQFSCLLLIFPLRVAASSFTLVTKWMSTRTLNDSIEFASQRGKMEGQGYDDKIKVS